MLELGTFGSVRGVPGNGYPYRNPRPLADFGSPKRFMHRGSSEARDRHAEFVGCGH
jgi:hypothetical protein